MSSQSIQGKRCAKASRELSKQAKVLLDGLNPSFITSTWSFPNFDSHQPPGSSGEIAQKVVCCPMLRSWRCWVAELRCSHMYCAPEKRGFKATNDYCNAKFGKCGKFGWKFVWHLRFFILTSSKYLEAFHLKMHWGANAQKEKHFWNETVPKDNTPKTSLRPSAFHSFQQSQFFTGPLGNLREN